MVYLRQDRERCACPLAKCYIGSCLFSWLFGVIMRIGGRVLLRASTRVIWSFILTSRTSDTKIYQVNRASTQESPLDHSANQNTPDYEANTGSNYYSIPRVRYAIQVPRYHPAIYSNH